MTLTEFLTTRLNEDEAAAKAAPGRAWTAFIESDVAGASVYDEQWVLLYPEHYDHDKPMSNKPDATGPAYIERSRDELAAHIARHDPARVLADVDAKRQIVKHYEQCVTAANDPAWQRNRRAQDRSQSWVDALAPVMRWLALPYADHPDYDEA